MIEPFELLRVLASHGVTFFTGVPDSLLKEFCDCVADRAAPGDHLIAANEGGAVAAALGYHLATGRTPLVYLQNSGLGNAINPLLSLADPAVYGTPMLLLIGWRGEPGTRDEPQHAKQGAVTLALLDAMELPYAILDADTRELQNAVTGLLDRARGMPCAMVVRKGTFAACRAPITTRPAGSLDREWTIAGIADSAAPGDLFVATTGVTARELYEHRVRRREDHARDFLVIGGMGHASQIAHALAVHQPSRQVYCLDGDGALLMHMGALATIGASRVRNFRHVVLNNGAHESVGGQPTAALSIDVPAIARAAGYARAARIEVANELPRAVRELREGDGPALLEVRIATGHRSDLGRPASPPAHYKNALMHGLR
jgi:phosphonopyruvate decarboxylase